MTTTTDDRRTRRQDDHTPSRWISRGIESTRMLYVYPTCIAISFLRVFLFFISSSCFFGGRGVLCQRVPTPAGYPWNVLPSSLAACHPYVDLLWEVAAGHIGRCAQQLHVIGDWHLSTAQNLHIAPYADPTSAHPAALGWSPSPQCSNCPRVSGLSLAPALTSTWCLENPSAVI